jgi:hypothetical protein
VLEDVSVPPFIESLALIVDNDEAVNTDDTVAVGDET